MKTRKRLALAALFVLVSCVVVAILILPPRDRVFKGQPETYWIDHLVYRDEAQVKQWADFGPEGVQVLIRALERANHPGSNLYRKAYQGTGRVLPWALMRFLPAPQMDLTRATRMTVADLLSRLAPNAKQAMSVMTWKLNDPDPSVRQIAITFFTYGEDKNAFLNQMEPGAKRKLLPSFIRLIQDKNAGVRNNAAIALGYFSEEAQTVAPVLTKALSDPMPAVRLLAAKSLNKVAPDKIVDSGVIPILITILKNPDDQIAYRAAELLGEFKKEPSLAVPALIESVQGTNRLVATDAASALGNFPDQADAIVPVLLQVYQSTNKLVSRWASGASLKKLDPIAAAKAGVK
ncbi:MAG: hypothetical protein JWR26_4935 [Pedosphaera sp.]|nr:hypothetical protein [Pedosphaera sp.]